MSTPQQHLKSHTSEESLFLALYRLIQSIKLHQDNNQMVKLCLTEFKKTISNINQDDELEILSFEGQFYINGERLRYRKQHVSVIQALLDFFSQRGLSGLGFDPSVRNVSSNDILAFVRLLSRSAEASEPANWLVQKVEDARFSWVSILQEKDSKRSNHDPDLREKATSTYFQALNSVKEVAERISSQGSAGVRKAKRLVQGMVDFVAKDETVLLGLSTIKDYDDYTYTHSVNVAVLGLCLGNRIGLSRTSLEHLGICGFFHDLGKVEVPREIITKPGKPTSEEWEEIKKHPLSSMRQILKLNATHDLKSKILLAPLEHHIKHDLTGYPQVKFKKEVSLLGRILHITDVYDAITSARVYRSSSFSPDQALSFMQKGAGTDFDPILLKVFTIMMGTYPVGTLLELDTGEMGLVVDYPIDSGGALPRIILLERDAQGDLKRGSLVDLAEPGPETGAYKRNVVKSLNAASCGIQPAQFIL